MSPNRSQYFLLCRRVHDRPVSDGLHLWHSRLVGSPLDRCQQTQPLVRYCSAYSSTTLREQIRSEHKFHNAFFCRYQISSKPFTFSHWQTITGRECSRIGRWGDVRDWRDGVTGPWRKLRIEELHDLFCPPDVLLIRSRRLRRNIYFEFLSKTWTKKTPWKT
jgi:hypothetical protein